MPCILPTSVNETIGEDTGDYYPVFSVETLQDALQHTVRKRQFVVYERDRSTALFFTPYGWKQENLFL